MDNIKKLGDIAAKYEDSFQFLQARKKRQANQLKLLVNLQKGDQTIASTLLLTLHNRVMSSLYDDKLQIKFLPSQGITQEQINAYNMLAQSDYIEMGKAKIDYDWIWDTTFFGRGYVETNKFDKKRKIMVPQVINPLVFGYDPIMPDVQDWRYYWKWITKTKYQLDKLIKAGVIDGITDTKEIASGVDPYLWEYKVIVDQARAGIAPSPEPYTQDVFQILEFYGNDDDGNRCVYWTDKNFAKILMKEELKFDDDGDGGSKWPIVVKESFRQPHSSIPFSIADLLDDKHRAKSVLLNLAYIAAKDQANPLYLYDTNKVTDVTQFLARQVNQHIPVNSMDGAVAPLQKATSMSPDLLNFINMMTQEANEPIGTGTTSQPDKGKGDNTATETAINQQLDDMAQSLLSKVLQFGEQEFWSHWFHRYAKNANSLGSKMANIVGVKGIDSKEVDLGVFNTDYPPGVMVYSAKEAEYKELVLRRDLMQLYPQLMQTLDPDSLRNFNKYVFFPKFLNDPSLIDVMLPETIDELKAKDENEQLAKEHLAQALPTDNHTTHLYIHRALTPKTWASWFHIAEHEQLLAEQQAQQQAAQQAEQAQQQGQPQASPPNQLNVGAEKRNPQAAASPLKTAITNQPQNK